MPEHAEVKLMTEFANEILCKRNLVSFDKNPISKMKFVPPKIKGETNCAIISRGKESRLQLTSKISGGFTNQYFFVNYGMSGCWKFSKTQWQKHAMISLGFGDGTFLEFVDARRFGSLKKADPSSNWSPNRGPDPVSEYDQFRNRIVLNTDNKDFNKPICELMLNQKWFNGVGNYLRSTILHDAGVNPFMQANLFSLADLIEIARCTRYWCTEAYRLGGAELYTWKNPDNSLPKLSDVIFYKKGLKCTDNTGRTFWFDPAWEGHCPYIILNK